MIGIYKITNLLTGKVYYGSSSHVEDRKEYHFRHAKNWKPKKDQTAYRNIKAI